MMSLTPDEAAELRTILWELEMDLLASFPDGYLRKAFPGEAELLGMPDLKGVVVSFLYGRFLSRSNFTSWADLERRYADDEEGCEWSPYEVAAALGCSLRDLGVVHLTDDPRADETTS